ncbi:hypothetical protein [Thermospira aquatica]|uniref:Uncharacterized protein n=1 Tax=Thermospira aquatica TaxID=2828656 RepID=A0AAX3BE54_9SPIR|nr:hypothetical protein [Thermospira aquatica]URA10579.1 hypothetical protein KDW03_01900 [Thermospira aquatica]
MAGAMFAMTGNPYGLDMSGRSLLIVKGAEDLQVIKNKYGIEIEKLLIQGEPYVMRGGIISKINESVLNLDETTVRPEGQDRLLELIYDPLRVYNFSDKKVRNYVDTGVVKRDDFLSVMSGVVYGFFSSAVNLVSAPFDFVKQPLPGVKGMAGGEDDPSKLYSWDVSYEGEGLVWDGMLYNQVELGSIEIDPFIKALEENIPPGTLFDPIRKIDSIMEGLCNNWFGGSELDKLVDNSESWENAGSFLFDLLGKPALKSLMSDDIRRYILKYEESLGSYIVDEYLNSIKSPSCIYFHKVNTESFIHFDYEKYSKWRQKNGMEKKQ